jgi:hypothetical protein
MRNSGLDKSIHWCQWALLALDMGPWGKCYPAIERCPRCRSYVVIDIDPERKGLWMVCQNCPAVGNVLEYAAVRWQVSVEEALARLLRTLPMVPKDYLDSQLADARLRDQTLRLFDIQATSALLLYEPSLRSMLSRQGLPVCHPEWLARAPGILYACEPSTIRPAVVERPSVLIAAQKRASFAAREWAGLSCPARWIGRDGCGITTRSALRHRGARGRTSLSA